MRSAVFFATAPLPALLILLLGLGAYAAWNGADWVQKREAAIGVVKAEEQEGLAFGRGFVETQLVMPYSQGRAATRVDGTGVDRSG